ncbi:hypothetical protein KBA27_06645 [bacterium]|nr:hypothetical protein [bacterium]
MINQIQNNSVVQPVNFQQNQQEKSQSIGLLMPPDKSMRPQLIPDSPNKKTLTSLPPDRYQKELTFDKKEKTPIGIKILFGLGGTALVVKFGKKILNNFKHKA